MEFPQRLLSTAILALASTLTYAAQPTPLLLAATGAETGAQPGNPLATTHAVSLRIDPASRQVQRNDLALSRLSVGDLLTVSVTGVGDFQYRLDHVDTQGSTLELSGALVGDTSRRFTLGLRDGMATSVIATPTATYAVGYGQEKEVLVGTAGANWMTDTLGQQLATQTRPLQAGEDLPRGAVPVNVNLARLHTLKPGEETVLQLPDLGATRVALDEMKTGETTTWIGHLADYGSSYTVTMTYSGDAINGYLVTPTGALTLANSNTGGNYLLNPLAAGYQPADGDCSAPIPASAQTFLRNATAASTATATSTPTSTPTTTPTATPLMARATTAAPTVDVLVYYTPGMLSAYGSLQKLTTRVDQLLALANQAYTAGKINYQVRRVGLELLNIADTSTNDSTLTQLASGSGAFSGVAAKRTAVGADLVTLIRPFYLNAQGGSCGIAYVTGASQTNVALYGNYGFSVVSDGLDHAGASAYCDDLAVAHEMGHNMGLMHDRTTVAKQGGGVGAYPYAYGYAVSGKWGTIMSYTYPHQVRFSNPADSTCNGNQVCGISKTAANSADNVSALALTMPLVAGFRAATTTTGTTTTSYTISGVATLNGTPTSGVSFQTNKTSVSCSTSGSTGYYSCTVPTGTTGLTITPSYAVAAGSTLTWQPASASFATLTANATQNFAGTLTVPTYALTITIKLNGVQTTALPVALTITSGDVSKVSCQVSTTVYQCKMPSGYKATITPLQPGGKVVTYSPGSQAVTISGNVTAAFTATR